MSMLAMRCGGPGAAEGPVAGSGLWAELAPAQTGAIHVHGPDDARRAEVERFIQAVYTHRFDARPTQFAPVLVSLQSADGRVVAAAGYRSAAHEPLFLERYLSRPVDELLADGDAPKPGRERIVEVGHLAATQAGAGRRLIFLIGPHLATLGFEWVVGTLTEELRHLFSRLGIAPLALGTADPAVLGDAAAQWGSYYEHRPLVLAGNLPQALRRLMKVRR